MLEHYIICTIKLNVTHEIESMQEDDIETVQIDENVNDDDKDDDVCESAQETHQFVVCQCSFGSKEEMVTHCLFDHPRF
jgi:hypothetical protein